MIYHAIIGSEPVAHPEIQSLLKGFLLPCYNGFTFGGKIFGPYLIDPHAYDVHQFVRWWDGGSKTILSASVMSRIVSYASTSKIYDC